MITCEKDTRITETLYRSSDYLEEFDPYGKQIFNTLRPNHSQGTTFSRLLQCPACQNKKAVPDIQRRLEARQELERLPTKVVTMRTNNKLAKSLGLSIRFNEICVKCGEPAKARNDKTRGAL